MTTKTTTCPSCKTAPCECVTNSASVPDLEELTWQIDKIYRLDLEEGRKRLRVCKLLDQYFSNGDANDN